MRECCTTAELDNTGKNDFRRKKPLLIIDYHNYFD